MRDHDGGRQRRARPRRDAGGLQGALQPADDGPPAGGKGGGARGLARARGGVRGARRAHRGRGGAAPAGVARARAGGRGRGGRQARGDLRAGQPPRRDPAAPGCRRGALEPVPRRLGARRAAAAPGHQRRAPRDAGVLRSPRRVHVPAPPHDARRGGPAPGPQPRAPPEGPAGDGGAVQGPARGDREHGEARGAARVHAREPGVPVPRPPGARRRVAVLVPEEDDVLRGPAALRQRGGRRAAPARARAGAHRQAGLQRVFPDRVGPVRLRARARVARAGARERRQQRGVLCARDHGRRPDREQAALRALPLGGAHGLARHRPRPSQRRPEGGIDPGGVPAVWPQGRGDDGERDHVPGAKHPPRGGQGARLPGRHPGPVLKPLPRGRPAPDP